MAASIAPSMPSPTSPSVCTLRLPRVTSHTETRRSRATTIATRLVDTKLYTLLTSTACSGSVHVPPGATESGPPNSVAACAAMPTAKLMLARLKMVFDSGTGKRAARTIIPIAEIPMASAGGNRKAVATCATALAFVYQPRRTSNWIWSLSVLRTISAIVTPRDHE